MNGRGAMHSRNGPPVGAIEPAKTADPSAGDRLPALMMAGEEGNDMNSYTELYAVELSDAEGHPEGLEVSAAKTYSGYSCETSYFVTVMDMETLDEIDGIETTFERLERDFNAMLAKYGGAGRIVRM